MKKKTFNVTDLNRVVKFLNGLNELSVAHNIGFGSYEDIVLTMDDQETAFTFDTTTPIGEALSLVVSV